MQEGVGENEIEISLRAEKPGDKQCESGDPGLKNPAPAVVTDSGERREQNKGQGRMKQGEKANPQREARVEEVFGSSNQVMPAEPAPARIQAPEQIYHERRDCLA